MKFKKAKLVIAGAVVVAVAGTAIGVTTYRSFAAEETEVVYKETTAETGNLTVGVTESGSVTVGTVTQSVDMDDIAITSSSTSSSSSSSSTSSGSSSSGSSSSGRASQSGGDMEAGAGGSGSSGSSTSSSSASSSSSSGSSSTSSSAAELVVAEVYVTVGQTVAEGDPLLKITDDSIADYRAELESAVESAQLALDQANLDAKTQELDASYTYDSNIANGNVAESEYNATITSLQNAVTQAQSAVDESAAKIADYQTRIAAGEDLSEDLSEEQLNYDTLTAKLQKAQNEYTTKSIEAEQTYKEAMLNYNNADSLYSIDTDGISDTVSEAEDTLAEAQEALTKFEAFIGDGVIYSEYTGNVMTVGYAADDVLSSDTDVATFNDSTAVTMSVSVSEEDITAVNIGDTVEITLNAYEDTTFTGTVQSMDTSASSGSTTVDYTVTVVFGGDTSTVYSDMTGNVTFITKQVEDVLYVSDKAIISEGTKSYVDVKDDAGNIEKVQVTTGFSDGVNVEIQSGLEEGETVLIESQVASES